MQGKGRAPHSLPATPRHGSNSGTNFSKAIRTPVVTPVRLSQEARLSTIVANSTARLSDSAYGIQDEHNGEDGEDGHNEQYEQDGLDGQRAKIGRQHSTVADLTDTDNGLSQLDSVVDVDLQCLHRQAEFDV
jgi:hypothetical protein